MTLTSDQLGSQDFFDLPPHLRANALATASSDDHWPVPSPEIRNTEWEGQNDQDLPPHLRHSAMRYEVTPKSKITKTKTKKYNRRLNIQNLHHFLNFSHIC